MLIGPLHVSGDPLRDYRGVCCRGRRQSSELRQAGKASRVQRRNRPTGLARRGDRAQQRAGAAVPTEQQQLSADVRDPTLRQPVVAVLQRAYGLVFVRAAVPTVAIPGPVSAVAVPGHLPAVAVPGPLLAVAIPGPLSVSGRLPTVVVAIPGRGVPTATIPEPGGSAVLVQLLHFVGQQQRRKRVAVRTKEMMSPTSDRTR